MLSLCIADFLLISSAQRRLVQSHPSMTPINSATLQILLANWLYSQVWGQTNPEKKTDNPFSINTLNTKHVQQINRSLKFVIYLCEFQLTGKNFCVCLIDDCMDADVPLVELNFNGKHALIIFTPFHFGHIAAEILIMISNFIVGHNVLNIFIKSYYFTWLFKGCVLYNHQTNNFNNLENLKIYIDKELKILQ